MDNLEVYEALLATKNFDKEFTNNILNQLKLFLHGVKIPCLVKPCTINDGIIKLDENEHKELLELHKNAALEGRLTKFVPASGAATRMFKSLQSVINRYKNYSFRELSSEAETDIDCKSTVKFLSNLKLFAFYDELKTTLNLNDEEINKLIDDSPSIVIKSVLDKDGLKYLSLPKGAVKFHKYPEGERTAFEEQIYESFYYLPDRHNNLRVHFTISEEHTNLFNKIIFNLKEKLKGTDFKLDISYSYQKKSTDTVAVDLENNFLFNSDGSLLMRPAGHGALLENLNDLNADLAVIKNIDNVCNEAYTEDTILFKKLLIGYLIKTQKKIFEILIILDNGDFDDNIFIDAYNFIKDTLQLTPDSNYFNWDTISKKDYLFEILDRPIRICGMVKNEGEPGGGPFWVSEDENLSKQIIEQAQINSKDESQLRIFRNSSYFNPVDIICGLRNYKGVNFDLLKFRDDESGIITIKSKDGIELKALELPGLWNGGMAYWNTIFVEVPISTFNPVKEINDLLRTEHQPK